MRVTLVDPERHLLDEISDPDMTRDDVAASYALALSSSEEIDWATINRAILSRWSMSALKYIKERAWRLRS